MSNPNGNGPAGNEAVKIHPDKLSTTFDSTPLPPRALARSRRRSLEIHEANPEYRPPVDTRAVANQLVASGFAVEYIERRYGLTRRNEAAA